MDDEDIVENAQRVETAPSPNALPNADDAFSAANFLKNCWATAPWTVTAIHANGGLESHTEDNYKAFSSLAQWIRAKAHTNLYWQVNALRCALGPTRPKARLEDVRQIDRLHVDLDPSPNAPGTVEEQRAAILALLTDKEALIGAGLPGLPTFLIDSGGGYWAFWDLVQPYPVEGNTQQQLREEAHRLGGHNKWLGEQLNKALGFKYADDCHNVDRIARLPFSINYPSEAKKAAGRQQRRAEVLYSNASTYTLDQFSWADVGDAGPCREEIDRIVINKDAIRSLPTGDAHDALRALQAEYCEVGERTVQRALFGYDITEYPDGPPANIDRSSELYNVNCALQYAGVPLEVVVGIISDPRFRVSDHLRFPNVKGKISMVEVRGALLLRNAQHQVRKAAADIALKEAAKKAADILNGPEQKVKDNVANVAQVEYSEEPKPAASADEDRSTAYGRFPVGARLNDILRIMNTRHAILLAEGGKFRILSWETGEIGTTKRLIPVLQTKTDFRDRYSHIKIQVGVKDGKPVMKCVADWWLENPSRLEFRAMRLMPREVEPGYLNLWRGFAYKPKQGNWSLMQRHILEVLADGNHDHTDYILRWAAWAVQNPDVPAEAALVFKGGKGIGKGLFARNLKDLFGQHGMQISSSGHLTGRFNDHLRDCCLLFADEAIAPSEKKAESILKALVTEPELVVEGKGARIIQTRNRLHIVMASNEDWVIPASPDERRYAIFEAKGEKKSKDYFAAIITQMQVGGAAAMLYDLLNMELGDWHPRTDIPQTEALRQQKMESLNLVEQFLHEALELGYIPGAKMGNKPNVIFSGDAEGRGPGLYTAMRVHTPQLKNLSPQKISKTLKKWGCTHATDGVGRGWVFPELAAMREAWCKAYGQQGWAPYSGWAGDERAQRTNGYDYGQTYPNVQNAPF